MSPLPAESPDPVVLLPVHGDCTPHTSDRALADCGQLLATLQGAKPVLRDERAQERDGTSRGPSQLCKAKLRALHS